MSPTRIIVAMEIAVFSILRPRLDPLLEPVGRGEAEVEELEGRGEAEVEELEGRGEAEVGELEGKVVGKVEVEGEGVGVE